MDETELKCVDEALDRFAERISDELFRRWEQWRVDLSEAEVYEVVGALLARQVTLATQLGQVPSCLERPRGAPNSSCDG